MNTAAQFTPLSGDTNTSLPGVRIQVENLKKSLGGMEILRGLSFEVEAGEIFVIMGPSGSGKSVLLRHLIGLESPDHGRILVNGHSIESPEVRSQYRMAMVFQSGALLNSLTVQENVGIYLKEHRLQTPNEIQKIVDEKLKLVGLTDIGHRYPSELSGGMRKRVAIARSLVIEPQLILYDEPTSELDPQSSGTIGKEILSLKHRIEVTSIVVSHDPELAIGIADRIAVINEGQIIFIGTTSEFKQTKDPMIHRLLYSDFKP
jgi:phospholipid/cholesterol/gamma-HCH transport system ATP-binding protein